jgi:carboxyl-terminal processing protease
MKSKQDVKPTKQKILGQLGFVLVIILAYGVGYLSGHSNLILEKKYVPRLVNTNVSAPQNVDFSQFWQVYKKVQANSFNKLDPSKALNGAIEGMVASIGDPYSVYMNKGESKDFLKLLNNEVDGVGVQISIVDNVLTVISPLPNSPADQAGLKPKDQILEISGQATKGMSLEDAADKIRGKSGSKVTLTVASPGQASRKVTITRQALQAASVTMSTIGDHVALIEISQFSDDTAGLMKKMADQIIKDKDKGVIVDLRNNPGGLLDASVSSSSLFLDNKTVVIEQDKNKKKISIKTNQPAILKDIPLVVLVNGGSASASEIFAGAMQDYSRAKILGETSYGKGTVQELIPLDNGGTLRLTIDQWLTPKGRTINHNGIKPDILVKDNEQSGQDEVVTKALDVLGLK